MMQCIMARNGARCEEWGVPAPGFRIFVCDECLSQLEDVLDAHAIREGALQARGVTERRTADASPVPPLPRAQRLTREEIRHVTSTRA